MDAEVSFGLCVRKRRKALDFTLEAAKQVAAASLVRRTQSGLFDLHELLRQYTAAHLEADPEAFAASKKLHYAFYLALAETADSQLRGPGQLDWLHRLEQEHDNLRAAVVLADPRLLP